MRDCPVVCTVVRSTPWFVSARCVQLERLAADKAAQQLQLERDLQAARQEAQQVGTFGQVDRQAQCADVSISVLGTRRCGIVCTTQQHTPNQTARVRR